jgi:signal transduction histidine kinase/ActR/RegA family two-component response regulator
MTTNVRTTTLAAAVTPSQKHITHIVQLEDDPHLTKILRIALHNVQPDIRLTHFTSSDSLLAFAEHTTEVVDTFVLDIRVPGILDGLEVATRLRARFPDSAIVLTTAYAPPSRAQLLHLSADYFQKPWQINRVVQHLLGLSAVLTTPALREETPALENFGTAAQRAITNKVNSRFERLTRRACTMLASSVQVPLTALVIVEKATNAIVTQIAQPDTLNGLLPHAQWQLLFELVSPSARPVMIEDLSLLTAERGAAGAPVAFAGIRVALPTTTQYGLLCAFDTSARVWNTEHAGALQQAASLLSEMFKMRDIIDDLIERNEELNAYSSIIAHELKSPLSAVVAYADSLRHGIGVSDPTLFLERILVSADRMSEMITHLLWMARLDRPLDTVHVVAIAPVIEATMRRLYHVLERRLITFQIDPDLPSALGHDVWIEEVFANLFSNAIKYIGAENPAPLIRLSARRLGYRVRYEVRDNGIGISAEDQAQLFKSFNRLNDLTRIEGTGLGLAIVQRIVARLGGEVGVESEPGHGSTFWFTLPAAKDSVEEPVTARQ